ncbi:hypothetical protein [Wolbachia endosymbiont of Brugia malayi]|uniref:hypothetical protein n=1 Tax=Wolbachia endosymbiont of Brugia malayi TaxID=80849 RepID=UPI0002FCB235|nr:hypothetical protein [Wolbachia endosymbiont of Brugia malayi]
MFTILVANNTIDISLSDNITKRLAQSIILYCNECILTGYFYSTIKDILPYGSQLLLAGSIASVPPISLLTQGVLSLYFSSSYNR